MDHGFTRRHAVCKLNATLDCKAYGASPSSTLQSIPGMRTMRAVWKDFGVVVYDTKNKSRDDKSTSKTKFVVASLEGRNNAVISLLVCNL